MPLQYWSCARLRYADRVVEEEEEEMGGRVWWLAREEAEESVVTADYADCYSHHGLLIHSGME